MRRTILQTIPVIVIIALLAMLPACAQKETTTKKVSVVKVGFVGPLTGGAASLGVPVRDAIALAEEQINGQKLIPDKRLKMVYEDDGDAGGCSAQVSTKAVQKLISQDKVRAVLGSLCSSATLADAPIAEQSKVVLLSFSSTNPAIKDSGDYIFRNVPSDSSQGVEGARLAKRLGAEKVAVVHINNDWGVGLKDVFSAEAEALGLEVAGVETYEQGATDFRTQLTKLKAKAPDAVYMLSYPADAGLVLKQMRELGMDVQVLGADATKDDAVIAAAGEAAEGLIVTLPGVPQSPELEAFAVAYKAKYGKDHGPYTPEAYDTAMIIAKACAETDCTPTAMKDYLYSMGEYKGASGTYAFDKDGEVQKPYDFFQVKDGKWEPYGSEAEEGAKAEA